MLSDEKEDEEEEKDDEEDSCGLLDESNRLVGIPLIRQAYVAVERSHTSGLTQSDIARLLGLPHLHARSICKQLKRGKICGTSMRDEGRQRVGVFYCSKYDTLNASIVSAVAKEKSKLLEQISKDIPVRTGPYSVRKRQADSIIEPPPKVLRLEHAPPESTSSNPSVQTTKITLKKNPVDDSVKTEIVVLKPEIKPGKVTTGLLDGRGEDSNNLTLRLLKRANLILKAVNNLKIIHDPQKLQRMINEEEEQEGSSYTVDRKSVLRILEKLELEGHLQRIKVTLTGAFKEKTMVFICHPSVSPNHSEIQSAIEQAKMKLPIITKDISKCCKDPLAVSTIQQLRYDHRIGKTHYGFKPKFIRLRNMHFYLYYLIYNYTGKQNLSVTTKRNILSNNNLDPSLFKEMGQVYMDKLDWKMFIPPLPVHKEYGEGWCLVSDILLRLPLFMFLSMVNIPYRINGIMDYLDHPMRKYYLVKDLPSEISYHLTFMRKYIFALTEILQQLAFIGLLQFGQQMMKEKDQVFIYLNRNACLVDTTLSEEGYNHISTDINYDQKSYHFSSTDDLEGYWSDLVKFAMNTKLGSKSCVVGKEIVVESVSTKRQMLEVLKAKTKEEALECDVGYIPGDGIGAAGVDSDMFVHLKRNWYWSSSVVNSDKDQSQEDKKIKCRRKSERTKKVKATTSNDKIVIKKDPDEPIEEERTLNAIVTIQKTPIDLKRNFQGKCHKKVTRLMLPKKSRSRKPYYDQKDKEALKRMKKLRVDWTPKEDNLLLLCKVANVFMCPYSLRKVMKNYSSIREMLHKFLPDCALNKTSRACQRRLIYMMKNPNTMHSVAICTEELNQDKELVAKYGHASMNRRLIKFKTDHKDAPMEGFRKLFDKMFVELIEILIDRLQSVKFNKSVLENDFIPDTQDEFYDKFTVAIPSSKKRMEAASQQKEVTNTTSIMESVLKTVLHSSLACVADKTCYSFQLLHIYQQYPDKLLRSIMADCRATEMISAKKYKRVLRNKVDQLKCLPFSTAPFKLSNSYMNKLQTKYHHQIFTDCYYAFSNFISEMDSGKSNVVLDLSVSNGGECALYVALYTMGLLNTKIGFPEHVIILDPKISETEETFSRILKRFNDLISHMKAKNVDKGKGYETDNEDQDDSKDDCTSYLEFNYSNRNNLASAASRLGLYTLRDEACTEASDTNIQHAHDYFVINPCTFTIHLESDNIDRLQSIFTNLQAKNDTLNRIKKLSCLPDLAKRPPESEAVKDLSSSARDLLNFIAKGKDMGATSPDVLKMFGDEIVDDINDLVFKQLIILTGAVKLRLIHYKFCKPWVILSYSLPRSIRDSIATGSERTKEIKEISSREPRQPGPSSSNEDSIKTEPRSYVKEDSNKTGEEVALPPSKRLRKSPDTATEDVLDSKVLKDLEVVIKPWIRVDGSLNRRVLDRMLGSVLNHICFAPGICLEKLQNRFSPALQPVHTHQLVLILRDLDCVTLKKLLEKPVYSLLSAKAEITFILASGFEDANDIFVEPDPMAIIKLGLFIGDKAYSGMYMDPENFSCS